MAFGWLTGLFNRRMAVGVGESSVNSILSAFDDYYGLGGVSVYRTAAVEFALGTVGRAFMRAKPTPALPELTPLVLGMMARQIFANGNSVWQILVDRRTGAVELIAATDYKISGDVREATWRYEYELERPDGERVYRNTAGQGMVHLRYLPNAGRPWAGISPLVRAGFTAEQLAKIEKSLSHDASIPTGMLMPLPDGVTQKQVDQASNTFAKGKGGITTQETTSKGFGAGQGSAPRADWDQKRFGPMIPASSITLWEEAMRAVMAACGMPPSLYTSEGSALRESWRHFINNTVQTVGEGMAHEISVKVEEPIEFIFPDAVKSDISARSRAYATLVGNGRMPPALAADIVGFMVPEGALLAVPTQGGA